MNRPFATLLCALFVAIPTVGLAPSAAAFPGPSAGADVVLGNAGVNAVASTVVARPDGSAVAAWSETNSSTYQLRAAQYAPAAGWFGSTLMDNQSVAIYRFDLFFDPGGNATLVWVVETMFLEIWYARLANGGTWSAAARLANVTTPPIQDGPQGAADASGRAYIAWVEGSGDTARTVAAVVDPAGAPGAPQNVSNGTFQATRLSIAPAPGGGATLFWFEWNGAFLNLSFSVFSPGSGWATPALGLEYAADALSGDDVGTDGTGTTTLLYGRLLGGQQDVAAVRYAPATGLGAPVRVGAASVAFTMVDVRVAVAPDGGAVVGWMEQMYSFFPFPGFLYNLRAAVFDPIDGWGDEVPFVENATAPPTWAIEARSGGQGLAAATHPNALQAGPLAWQHSAFEGCRGWSALSPTANETTPPTALSLAMAPQGSALLLYAPYNDTYRLHATTVDLVTLPRVTLDAPANGTVLQNPVANVTGTTVANSHVEVGGIAVTANASGIFQARVPLDPGTNHLTARATLGAPWGPCVATASVTVVYNDPVPALRKQLDDALANVSALQVSLVAAIAKMATAEAQITVLEATGNATADDLATAWLELNTTRASLAASQAALAATTAELDRIKVQFPWLTDNLTKAQQDVSATQAQLVAANLRIDALSARLNATNTTGPSTTDTSRVDAAASAAQMAMVLGGLGIAIGATGLVAALNASKKRGPPPAP